MLQSKRYGSALSHPMALEIRRNRHCIPATGSHSVWTLMRPASQTLPLPNETRQPSQTSSSISLHLPSQALTVIAECDLADVTEICHSKNANSTVKLEPPGSLRLQRPGAPDTVPSGHDGHGTGASSGSAAMFGCSDGREAELEGESK